MLGSLNLATQILAARLIVLIAVLGGIGLTWNALAAPDAFKLATVTAYGLLVVGPSVWLASR